MGWKRFFLRRRWDRERAMELESYIAHETQENLERGMPPEQAVTAARRKLGNAVRIREEIYDWNTIAFLENLWKDVGYAVRTLRQKPLLTAAIVLTLGIGVGAAGAMFSIVQPVLLRPLPYASPDNLVAIWGTLKDDRSQKVFAGYADYEELENNSLVFDDVAANTWARAAGQTLVWRGEPHNALVIPSTQNLFSFLGVSAFIGRTFAQSDLRNSCTAVVAHRFWQNELTAAREVVGGNVTLNGETCTVVGVMPPAFEFFPKQTDVWTLITPAASFAGHPTDPASSVAIFARLKPRASLADAQGELARLHENVVRRAPAGNWLAGIVPQAYDLQGEFNFLASPNLRLGLVVLSAAVGILLFIACLNIAGLLLVRGADREKDLAVRAALGCGRARTARQLLLESVILAALGSALGVAVAAIAIRYFQILNPIQLPPGNPVVLNWSVVSFAVISGLITGALSGLAPASRLSGADLNQFLKGAAPTMASAWSAGRWGKGLVVLEMALSMVLLLSAALLIESMHRLMTTPLGFRTDRLITAQLRLPPDSYAAPAKRAQFYDAFVRELRALPGTESVALSSDRPLSSSDSGYAITVPGRPAPTTPIGDVGMEEVSAQFLRAMGISLLKGREFNDGDRKDAPQVIVVNQKFAEEYFPNEDPIGKQIKPSLPGTPAPWLMIVGVASNVRRGDFFKEMGYRTPPIMYRPIIQNAPIAAWLFMRTGMESKNVAELVKREVSKLDGRAVVHDFTWVDELVEKNFAQPRFRSVLLGVFAGIALVLAAVGLYGLLMQSVLQRTREIAIRIAVGAERRRIVRMVIAQGIRLTVAGISAGVMLSIVLAGFLRRILFGVAPTDAAVLLTTSGILLCIAVLSTWWPARRASRIDPMRAIK